MPRDFKIDPRVEELLRKGEISKKVAADVSVAINKLVEKLRKKHPGHDDVICRHLDGESIRLRSEKEAAKEKDRQKERDKNKAKELKELKKKRTNSKGDS